MGMYIPSDKKKIEKKKKQQMNLEKKNLRPLWSALPLCFLQHSLLLVVSSFISEIIFFIYNKTCETPENILINSKNLVYLKNYFQNFIFKQFKMPPKF